MSLVFLENKNECLIYTCDGHIIDDKLIHSQYFSSCQMNNAHMSLKKVGYMTKQIPGAFKLLGCNGQFCYIVRLK